MTAAHQLLTLKHTGLRRRPPRGMCDVCDVCDRVTCVTLCVTVCVCVCVYVWVPGVGHSVVTVVAEDTSFVHFDCSTDSLLR